MERVREGTGSVAHWFVPVAGGLWPTSAGSFDPPLA